LIKIAGRDAPVDIMPYTVITMTYWSSALATNGVGSVKWPLLRKLLTLILHTVRMSTFVVGEGRHRAQCGRTNFTKADQFCQ
jgi:hypothetical protein